LIKLTIFVQCYNRPAYARRAIESVLKQTNQQFRLVISDNSNNDEMHKLVQLEFPKLEYRRRVPSLSAFEHFNKSIAEADTEFLCLFHDDDLMETGFVDAMLQTIALYPHAVAYSCNGVTIDEDIARDGDFFEAADEYVKVDGPRELVGRYFSRHPSGFAPFPAYIYRSSLVKKIPMNPEAGGKYSDVAWLLDISKHGLIVWSARRLFRYRMHTANDSNTEVLRDRLKLLGYFKNNEPSFGKNIIDDYRFGIYKQLRVDLLHAQKSALHHLKFIENFLLSYRLKRIFRRDTYAYLAYKFKKLFFK
jgi:glycosyltransferase involved in cell wall biosynthesis